VGSKGCDLEVEQLVGQRDAVHQIGWLRAWWKGLIGPQADLVADVSPPLVELR
jgi:hypothetical protein